MRSPILLKHGAHGKLNGADGQYFFYKKGRTKERPFFFTQPNPINLYPGKQVTRVVVAGLSLHRNERDYDISGDEWVAKGPFTAPYGLNDLRAMRPGVITVPLGLSPMIATQLFTLLHRERALIHTVALVYPGANAIIEASVRHLEYAFTRAAFSNVRGAEALDVVKYPVAGFGDIDSPAACSAFGACLVQAINEQRQKHRDSDVLLSLSGGRKGMAALTYLAAQRAGLTEVWHTLITDAAVEQQVARFDWAAATPAERAGHLFLQPYRRDAFTAFAVPVVPLSAQQ